MTETIILDVNLQAFVRRDAPRRWVASCPKVGVVSQGSSANDAKRCLQEAVELWFESCIERGVLDQALRESNFHPSPLDRRSNALRGRRKRSVRKSVLGDPFDIRLTIPAYEASPLLVLSAS